MSESPVYDVYMWRLLTVYATLLWSRKVLLRGVVVCFVEWLNVEEGTTGPGTTTDSPDS